MYTNCSEIGEVIDSSLSIHYYVFTETYCLLFQDIFEAAWMMMSHKNFQRVSLDGSPQELNSDSMQTDQNGASGGGNHQFQ